MLTPQEVAEHAFSKASFGGYNMAMVDDFLDLVTADYTSLYKENAALKAKMKVLADKVEEYRTTEEAMRRAMLTAQKTADEMVKEAEGKAAAIVSDAEREAADKIAAIRREVESEQLRLTAAQNATASYISKLKELYQNEMDYIASLSKLNAAPKVDTVAQAADAIGTAVEKAVEEESPAPAAAPAPAAKEPETEEDEEPTIPMEGKRPAEKKEEPPMKPLEEDSLYQELRRGIVPHPEAAAAAPAEPEEKPGETPVEEPTKHIDFSHLKFGKDYEIG